MKKRSLHIVQLIPALNEGGVERGVVELNTYLIKKGYKSSIITAEGKQIQKIISDGGNVHLINIASKNPIIFVLSLFKLKKCLQTIQPDILHARSRIPAWQTYLINRSLKIPFITTVHGFNHISIYSEIMTKGDVVIAVSNPVKNYIIKNYRVSSNKIRVVHRGIDLNVFNPNMLDLKWIQLFKNKYNLNDHFVISIIGRITELKGHTTYLKCLFRLKKNKKIKGLIVGGIPSNSAYFNKLRRLITELNLQDDVIFTGSQSKLPEIYHLSNMVVSCSNKPESFGRVITEAMAMNTPVIATKHGGSLDIIPKDREDLLFSPNDVTDLYNKIINYDFRTKNNFRGYVEKKFSNNSMLSEISSIYEAMIK